MIMYDSGFVFAESLKIFFCSPSFNLPPLPSYPGAPFFYLSLSVCENTTTALSFNWCRASETLKPQTRRGLSPAACTLAWWLELRKGARSNSRPPPPPQPPPPPPLLLLLPRKPMLPLLLPWRRQLLSSGPFLVQETKTAVCY